MKDAWRTREASAPPGSPTSELNAPTIEVIQWTLTPWSMEDPHGLTTHASAKVAAEATKKKRDVEEKTCATHVENPDIRLMNTTASPRDCI